MKKLFKITLFLIPILLIIQLVINNSLATKGQELRQIQNQIDQLTEHNHQLQASLSQKQSLTYISAQAQQSGLIPAQEQLSIAPPSPLALNTSR